MKHIFHVHSYVNYLTALGVIQKLSLNNENVVLTIARGIPLLNNDYVHFNIEDYLYYHTFNNLKHLPKFKWVHNKEIISAIDDKIMDAIGDRNFIYYCPHSRGYLYQVFITHSNCRGVHYIEDGMDAFLSREAHEKKFPYIIKFYQKVLRNTLFRLPVFARSRLGMFNNAFRSYFDTPSKLFVLSKDSFKNVSYVDVDVVDMKSITNVSLPSFSSSSKIFIFDAVVEQDVVSEAQLKEFIIWFCSYFCQIKELHVKFHPFQQIAHREWIKEVFENNGFRLSIIADSVPIEYLFVKSQNLDVYGIGSSLLIYASKFSAHNVTVLYPYFSLAQNHRSNRDTYWESAFSNDATIRLLGRDFEL